MSIKDLSKIKEFYKVSEPFFSGFFDDKYNIIDFCSGNGFAGYYFKENNKANKIIFIDKAKVRDFGVVESKLKSGYEFIQTDIRDFKLKELDLTGNNAIISVHACGELTDIIIREGLENQIPFSIMTCCHKKSQQKMYNNNSLPKQLLLYDKFADYVDLLRIGYIKENDWTGIIKRISDNITPMNNVI